MVATEPFLFAYQNSLKASKKSLLRMKYISTNIIYLSEIKNLGLKIFKKEGLLYFCQVA